MKTHFKKFTLLLAFFSLSLMRANAITSINISTGVNDFGNPIISPGTNDDSWTVAYATTSWNYVAAKVSNGMYINAVPYIPGWIYSHLSYPCQPSTSSSRWISPFVNPSGYIYVGSDLAADYNYKRDFEIPSSCEAIESAILNLGYIAADNNIYLVEINGYQFTINPVITFGNCNNNTTINIINAATVLHSGTNTITVYTHNNELVTAFLLQGSVDITYYNTGVLLPFISVLNSYCAGDPINISGFQTYGYVEQYQWAVLQCDQYGNQVSGLGFLGNITNGPVADINFYDCFPQIQCGWWYKITLGVWNHCLGWKYTSKIIFVDCKPVINSVIAPDIICIYAASYNITVNVSSFYTSIPYKIKIVDLSTNQVVPGAAGNTLIYNPSFTATISPPSMTSYSIIVTNPNTGCFTVTYYYPWISQCNRKFDIFKNTTSPDHFSMTATPQDQEADQIPGFHDSWFLQELSPGIEDPIYTFSDPACWDVPLTTPVDFNGVDNIANIYSGNIVDLTCSPGAGRLGYDRTYRVTRGVWNDFEDYEQYSVILSPTYGKDGGPDFSIIEDPNAPDMSNYSGKHNSKGEKGLGGDELSLAIAPNPSSGIFNIQTNAIGTGTIEVYNTLGSKIQTITLENSSTGYQLDLSGFPTGIYLLNLNAEGKRVTKRIVLE